MIKILFYGPLARITEKKIIEVEASTIKEAFEKLTLKYGDRLKTRLYDDSGKPRRFINIYVNGKDIRYLNNLETSVKEGDAVSIIPSVTGG